MPSSAASRTDLINEPVRIGLLGVARITTPAIAVPARLSNVELVAVAARDRQRAAKFAGAFGIERVLNDYAAVIACSAVEAIYNPLPNGMHAPWNLAAIAAGKHVLSEKPFAANANEAAQVEVAAAQAPVVVMEGFHYVYHPVMLRLCDIVASGELGDVQLIETVFEIPSPPPGDLRWSHRLAGGATMDTGCYCLHALRVLGRQLGGEPTLVSAEAVPAADSPDVDARLTAELSFASGAKAQMRCAFGAGERQATLRVVGSEGEVVSTEFVEPHLDDRLRVTVGGVARVEHPGRRATYAYQLDAFVAAVRHGAPVPTDTADALATMRLIDQCYVAAGMQPRPNFHS